MSATAEPDRNTTDQWFTTWPTGAVEADDGVDGVFIAALVLFVLGGILLFVAIIKLALWLRTNRKRRHYKKWWLRQLEVKRHLSEYSIRTKDDFSEIGKSSATVNEGFEDDDVFRDDSAKSSPESSPKPGSSTSADIHSSAEDAKMGSETDKIIDSNMNDTKKTHIL